MEQNFVYASKISNESWKPLVSPPSILVELRRISCEDKNTFIPTRRVFMNFNCITREWAKWVGKPVKGASEWKKQSIAEDCVTGEWSERCKQDITVRDWATLWTRPSRLIRCSMWIAKQMRYRSTDRPTYQPTDHLKTQLSLTRNTPHGQKNMH